jgi:hypothetical protein
VANTEAGPQIRAQIHLASASKKQDSGMAHTCNTKPVRQSQKTEDEGLNVTQFTAPSSLLYAASSPVESHLMLEKKFHERVSDEGTKRASSA